MQRSPPLRAASLAVLLLALLCILRPASAEEKGAASDAMEDVIRRFEADEASLRSFYDEPLAALRLERFERFLAQWDGVLSGLALEQLDVEGRVDYVLLRNHLERRRDALTLETARNAETLALLPFVPALLEMDRTRWRPKGPTAARKLADALTDAAASLKVAREVAEKVHKKTDDVPAGAPAVTPVIAYRAARDLERVRGVLAAWFTFHDGYDPQFAWWVRKPYEALVEGMKGYEHYLRETVAGVQGGGAAPLIGDPIGRGALCNALAREMIPYTPEELLAVAEAEFAWCEAEGARAAQELGQADWRAAVEHVKGLHRDPGEQPALVTAQAEEAMRFLEERDLVTVPPLCAETWRLRMISQKGQETLPFAVYNDQHMLVAYAMSGMDHESKLMSMRGNNAHFTRLVTPHELIPGHHLQLFQAARYRPYRSLFRTAFFVEGWALHWEMLLWDLDWHRDAADRVGMLFWRMHRCARIIVTLQFHLGRMQPDAMVELLMQRVGLERDGATGEVRRYIGGAYGPLYQCAYMIGGLQLRALHHDLVGGGTMSNRAFHDAVLRQGSIPIELVRAALTGQKLARDHHAAWRWRGDVQAEGAPCPR